MEPVPTQRRVHHRKAASDTFAWAAQPFLLQQLPEGSELAFPGPEALGGHGAPGAAGGSGAPAQDFSLLPDELWELLQAGWRVLGEVFRQRVPMVPEEEEDGAGEDELPPELPPSHGSLPNMPQHHDTLRHSHAGPQGQQGQGGHGPQHSHHHHHGHGMGPAGPAGVIGMPLPSSSSPHALAGRPGSGSAMGGSGGGAPATWLAPPAGAPPGGFGPLGPSFALDPLVIPKSSSACRSTGGGGGPSSAKAPADFAGQTRANALDPSQLDPKRAKRIIANRQSAHRSRMKKLQQIHELEEQVNTLRANVRSVQHQLLAAYARRGELTSAAVAARASLQDTIQEVARQTAIQEAIRAELRALSVSGSGGGGAHPPPGMPTAAGLGGAVGNGGGAAIAAPPGMAAPPHRHHRASSSEGSAVMNGAAATTPAHMPVPAVPPAAPPPRLHPVLAQHLSAAHGLPSQPPQQQQQKQQHISLQASMPAPPAAQPLQQQHARHQGTSGGAGPAILAHGLAASLSVSLDGTSSGTAGGGIAPSPGVSGASTGSPGGAYLPPSPLPLLHPVLQQEVAAAGVLHGGSQMQADLAVVHAAAETALPDGEQQVCPSTPELLSLGASFLDAAFSEIIKEEPPDDDLLDLLE